MDRLEQEIKKLADKLTLKKQKLASIKEVNRRRQIIKDRRARAGHIHRIGAIVEKMGLDHLEYGVLLGALAMLHGTLESGDPSVLDEYRSKGQPFVEDGVRLPTIEPGF